MTEQPNLKVVQPSSSDSLERQSSKSIWFPRLTRISVLAPRLAVGMRLPLVLPFWEPLPIHMLEVTTRNKLKSNTNRLSKK
jgi:hypothetical protein